MTKWETFFDEKIKEIAKEKTVIDIGGGRGFIKELARYKKYFTNCGYKSLDFDPETKPDILADAHQLPFKNNSIDAVICKAVLEHVQEPQKVIDEIHRILRSGGKCFVYVPFLYNYHGSGEKYRDYYRFTKDGIEYLFRKFSKIEICPVRGHLETVFYLLPHLNRVSIFLGLARFLDKISTKYQSQNQASGYYIFLIK